MVSASDGTPLIDRLMHITHKNSKSFRQQIASSEIFFWLSQRVKYAGFFLSTGKFYKISNFPVYTRQRSLADTIGASEFSLDNVCSTY